MDHPASIRTTKLENWEDSMTESTYTCFGCGTPMKSRTESRCCSAQCEQDVLAIERASMDELMDDRLAEMKFLRPINPDPITAMAKELKRRA